MPIIESSTFRPPRGLRTGHAQTMLGGAARQVRPALYQRERVPTPDGDFLDLDWLRAGRDRLVIVTHGLEGSSRSPYVMATAAAFFEEGWDAVAWNFRGCGGEPNRGERLYHSGETGDLDFVCRHARAFGYRTLALIGFSLGGNVLLKYLGEQGAAVGPDIRAAAAFSAPVDLHASSLRFERTSNALYLRYFMNQLVARVRLRQGTLRTPLSYEKLDTMRTFRDFDDAITAPLHGFADAVDYYRRSSAKPYLARITVPTLLVNASDDPFLPEACFPFEEARNSRALYLEVPAHGGHCGFLNGLRSKRSWAEQRALAFIGDPPDLSKAATPEPSVAGG